MKASVGALGVAVSTFLWAIAIAATTETKQSSYDLQSKFSTATNLVVKQRWQDVTGDAASALQFVGKSFVLSKPGFANLGEEWSISDYIVGDKPRALHLFTAYSDEITSSVFLVGGREVSLFTLLADRGDEKFCVFKMPPLSLINLRVAVIQEFLNPKRDGSLGKLAKCQWQSPSKPLVLPRD